LAALSQFTLLVRSQPVVDEVYKISRNRILLIFGQFTDLGDCLLE
jgi:hypothetical protein